MSAKFLLTFPVDSITIFLVAAKGTAMGMKMKAVQARRYNYRNIEGVDYYGKERKLIYQQREYFPDHKKMAVFRSRYFLP